MTGTLGKIGRRAARQTVRGIFTMFPQAGREVLPTLVKGEISPALLQQVLSGTPVESLTVRGEQGVFEGAAQDVSVIQRYALQGSWSPRTLTQILAMFGPDAKGTYIDVGANIGLTAVPVAKAGIHVIAFEPVPRNFGYLGRNAARNGAAAADLRNLALLDQPGEVTFELSPSNHGDHRYRREEAIAYQGEDKWATQVVRADVLDSVLDLIADPLVIKIDTQGSEPLVFAGGRRVCAAAAMIIAEFSPYAMHRMGVDPEPMIDVFAAFRTVEVFVGEDESRPLSLAGDALRIYLRDYCTEHRAAPYGRYLNLIGRR